MTNLLERSVNFIPWQARHWIKHIPIVAWLQRLLFQKFFSGRAFLHQINAGPAKGLNYPISLPLDKAIWTGAYEAALAQAVTEAVSKGDVCYDIGAYRGFFSGVFALAGASRVVAFEPFPANCVQVERLAASNPQLPLTFEQAAIGKECGIAEFKVMPDSSMGKLASSSFQADVQTASVLRVPLKTLDGLISEGKYPAPQVVKIDVEGAEAEVLRGAMNMLRNQRPRLFIEAHSHALSAECAALLQSLDYSVTVLETKLAPNAKNDPEICHLIARPNDMKHTTV